MATLEEKRLAAKRKLAKQKLSGAIQKEDVAEEQAFMDAAMETGKTIGGAIGGEVFGGLFGLYELAKTQDIDAANQAMEAVRQGFQVLPEGERSKEQLQDIAGVVEKGAELVNLGLATGSAIGELAAGKSVEEIKKDSLAKDIQEKGISKALGEETFERTGSPLAATVAESLPTASAEIAGFKGAGRIKAPGTDVVSDVRSIADTGAQMFKRQSRNKQQIANILQESPTDVRGFGFEIERPKTPDGQVLPPDQSDVFFDAKDQLKAVNEVGQVRVKRSKRAKEAAKQGFEEQTIQFILGSSPADKVKYKKIVDTARQLRRDKSKAENMRLTDTVGESLAERARFVLGVNREAGKRVGEEAKKLPDNVDFAPTQAAFMDDLENDLGVEVVGGKPRFLDSQIEDFATDRKAITDILKMVQRRSEDPSGKKLHDLKKRIDRQVTFGKQSEGGLSPEVDNVLKKLRHNINETLGNASPEYREANQIFRETVGALDELQSIGGKRLDIEGPSAERSLGILSRRLAGNAVSSAPLKESINTIEAVARKYGGDFDDSIFAQLQVAEDLNSIFKTQPQTSLKGEMTSVSDTAQAAAQPGAALLRAADKGFEKVRGINEENAFKALEALLEE